MGRKTAMARNEARNQETAWHETIVNANDERDQVPTWHEKTQEIAVRKQHSTAARIVYIIYFLFTALELLLAVRVVLYLIGANADNGFASFVYGLSAPFVGLFASLVQNPVLGTTSLLEITTLIAMVAYAILGWLLGRVVWLTLSRPR
jgi:YggT family protein